MDERSKWLESLGVGSKVAYKKYQGDYCVSVVSHKTPAGKLKVDGNLYTNGVHKYGQYGVVVLEPVTEGIQETVDMHNIKACIYAFVENRGLEGHISIQQLKDVYRILYGNDYDQDKLKGWED